ncbi:bifunctional hydroxymethylpyrimidine kinase/phosphomethylpyrimidine kinase [Desulfomonile tiedjei]|uniref:hydroxymethylpyrimidine kinase n=1 Tax=Desulfomonile tiedjei (strain ATCC 49306 / DSM 6799 / DCB-1) TaxID=706587 RepID=I4C3W0_DESTA|nr:bifunctional hydroxymethylpyrimidine kinase/phosphomethylpyrimidine kinase [Desulfomonile tiedjei]AFM24251.1 phosphomethylpyrimidine kinase [Desulfomonile tiedjei DSM 6799]
MQKILTIAGSDSGGGSGIQGDLKTILSLGGYGMSVITAVTAQNTMGIQGIVPMDPDFVALQLESVLSDIGADAVKTGMLANADIVSVVAEILSKYKIDKLVVDPVLVSESGKELLEKEGISRLVDKLFPMTYLLTPNIPEAEALTGKSVTTVSDMIKAGKKLQKMGPKYVLVKGGHLQDSPVDVLHDGSQYYEFATQRVRTRHTHGTGCTLASAIATLMGRGLPLMESIDQAKRYLYRALRFSLRIGSGIGPTNHLASITREMARTQTIEELDKALERLKRLNIGHLIPEVQSNLAYAIPFAESVEDVASFPGRIIRMIHTVATMTGAKFGASRQIHHLVLAAMDYDPERRAAMNIAFSDVLVRRIRSLGFTVAEFDRNRTPPDLQEEEGSTLAWGVQDVMEELGRVPDAIFDRGAVGKVAMIRLFGKDPGSIVDLIAKL